jgi:hypothetical protein
MSHVVFDGLAGLIIRVGTSIENRLLQAFLDLRRLHGRFVGGRG